MRHVRDNEPTVVQILEDYIPASGDGGSPRRIDVNDVILSGVGYGRNNQLDLIASRLELSRTLKNPTGKERRLARAIGQVSERYDLVVIDCAPTESILTDVAYFASRFVVVPVKPEFMATIGLPLLARSIREFGLENEDHELEIAGLVVNDQSRVRQQCGEKSAPSEKCVMWLVSTVGGFLTTKSRTRGRTPRPRAADCHFPARPTRAGIDRRFQKSQRRYPRSCGRIGMTIVNQALTLRTKLLVAEYGRKR